VLGTIVCFRLTARRRLDALDLAVSLDDLRLPGFGLHRLEGDPAATASKVNGPWRITFEWHEAAGDAHQVDLEQ
jgi:proteic killer suppression protein